MISALLFLLSIPSQAGCWTLPDQCHSMVLKTIEGELVLKGKERGARQAVFRRKNWTCLELVKNRQNRCDQFYHCKPTNVHKTAELESDMEEFVEIRLSTSARGKASQAEYRYKENRRFGQTPRWKRTSVKFKRWTRRESGSPLCLALGDSR